MKQKTRRGFFRRWIERLLLAAGIAGLGLWAWSNALPILSQDWDNWVFESELRHQTATVGTYLAEKRNEIVHKAEGLWHFALSDVPEEMRSSAPTQAPRLSNSTPSAHFVRNKDLVGRVTIPRLHLSAIVREGVGNDILGLAVGHVPGTAIPGEEGNVAIAGHRDTLFRTLREIHTKDVIQFETLGGIYNYQVESTEIVSPKDVGVLKPGVQPELTLVTCYPFNYIGSAPERFVVKAQQVSREPQPLLNIAETGGADVKPGVSRAPHDPNKTTLSFTIATGHSKQLAPGISAGIDETNVAAQSVNGWIWLMPDRRTIWLRHQSLHEPVVFYGGHDGARRELRITRISHDSVSGYIIESPRSKLAKNSSAVSAMR